MNCIPVASLSPQNVSAQHVGEDKGKFTELLRARPHLESVIANLVQDRQMIAAHNGVNLRPGPSTPLRPGPL